MKKYRVLYSAIFKMQSTNRLGVFFVFILCIVCIFSCKKKEVVQNPSITFVDISPSKIVQFKEPVFIRFSYTDPDGDVGEDNPDTYSLEIRDSRLKDADYYHIPPLSPPSTSLNISGELKIRINKIFLIGNSKQETTSFRVRIKDKAGNWSNEITTSSLVVDSI